ncbi:hypothetical protein RchiOBHm_Chr1g0352051 [Rosa chinensis]|uniref:EXS domain-containing protein n=1 Tax=Rosa chinensis TaxID=74649 RepID=A0A2P6SGG9_ROSCH|nr:hypothetical protein RchiOBHm_Chr1g0352051 [Rosa chinensis]
MRSPLSQIHTAAVFPSPVFLWRLKDITFSGTTFHDIGIQLLQVLIGWDSAMRMSADLRHLFLYEAFLYYNPPLLMVRLDCCLSFNFYLLQTLMVWLWGVNLWVFSQANIGYAKIFDLDQNHLTHKEVWKVSLYIAVAIVLISPFDIFYLSSRYFLLRTLCRIALPVQASFLSCSLYPDILGHILPKELSWLKFINELLSLPVFYPNVVVIKVLHNLRQKKERKNKRNLFIKSWNDVFMDAGLYNLQAISFPDFFVAEVLTSMSKVFSDLERSVCRMVHGLVATIAWLEADSVCGSHSIGIPLVHVFPYVCRLFQCLRQYKDTKDKTNLFNALKYSTAVPVIFLSALKYHVFPDRWTNFYEPLWLLSSIVNSLYSFYWDIAQDWDLSGFTRIFKFSRPSLVSYLLYGQKWVYFWAIGSNLILRCAWTYKFSAHLRHNYMAVFAITALEILRRFQWVFFRVENEWNKINKSSYDPLPMTIIQTEEETLLDANSHSV